MPNKIDPAAMAYYAHFTVCKACHSCMVENASYLEPCIPKDMVIFCDFSLLEKNFSKLTHKDPMNLLLGRF